MGKDKGKAGIPNRHLHSRISYLQQAATYLTLQAQGKPDGSVSVKLPQDANKVHVGNEGVFGSSVNQAQADHIAADVRPDEHSTPESGGTQLDRHWSGGVPLHLTTHLRQIAQKSQIRLHTSIKHSICKTCSSVLIDGETCLRSIENLSRGGKKPSADVLVLKCDVCGAKRRFPVGAKRQKRKSERTNVHTGLVEATGEGESSGELTTGNTD